MATGMATVMVTIAAQKNPAPIFGPGTNREFLFVDTKIGAKSQGKKALGWRLGLNFDAGSAPFPRFSRTHLTSNIAR
jgi:hypothetical protein